MKRKCLLFLATATLICNIALGGVWIVCDDDGSNPSVTKAHALAVFAEANTVLRQVGMTLDITADSIQYINRSAWKIANTTTNTFPLRLRNMGSVPKGNSNLRIFFVDTINGSNRIGFNSDYCMTIAKNASGIVLAHEVCHAGGLRDIYITQGNISLADAGTVKAEYLPMDWSGYYPQNLSHTNLITRLLMYGYIQPNMGDIPLGRIYGVYRPKVNGQILPPTKDMVPVGIQDLNRQPKHLDFDLF